MFSLFQKKALRKYLSSKKEMENKKTISTQKPNRNNKIKISKIHRKRASFRSKVIDFNSNSAKKTVKLEHKSKFSSTCKNKQQTQILPRMSLKDCLLAPKRLSQIKENVKPVRQSKLKLSETFLQKIKIKRLNECSKKYPFKNEINKSESPSIENNYSQINNSSIEPHQIKEYVMKRFRQSFTSIEHINLLFENLLLIGTGSYAKAYLVESILTKSKYVLKTFDINTIKHIRHFNRIMVSI